MNKQTVKTKLGTTMKVLITNILLILVLFTGQCMGSGDVDLDSAKKLIPVDVDTDDGGDNDGGDNGGNGTGPAGGFHNIFSFPPGHWARLGSYTGAVDGVGTTIVNDYDGDGIINDNETTTSVWAADYPIIEAEIAPPIILKIRVEQENSEDQSEITSNISSDQMENSTSEGSEDYHQNDNATRTVQYEVEKASSETSSSSSSNAASSNAASSSSNSNSTTASTTSSTSSGEGWSVSGFGRSSSESSSSNHTSHRGLTNEGVSNNNFQQTNVQNDVRGRSKSIRRQVFEDRPFVNTMNRNNQTVRSDEASKNARKYRKEKRAVVKTTSHIPSDAGYVRAAMYIKNQSVNMPVHVSDIKASLLFEKATGELVPIKSFILKDEDYSDFEVDIYGGSTFGPYVIELNNLNTVEVENAISLGYTPRIFITDYRLTHVKDSNYKSALSGDFDDNIKIAEENAKGRSALIKIMSPGIRQMFRVSAFDMVPEPADICDVSEVDPEQTDISPGVSLRKVLERLKCSGVDVEFEHYVIDYTGGEFTPKVPKVYLYGLKRIGDAVDNRPCDTTINGTTIQGACVIKVFADNFEDANLKTWQVFGNARYFDFTEYQKVGGEIQFFSGDSIGGCGQETGTCGIPMLKAYESLVWAGDNYDIVYIQRQDVENNSTQFGTQNIETGQVFAMSTKWDYTKLGATNQHFYPESNSRFIGEAAPGDELILEFNLEETVELNASFGTATDTLTGREYNHFDYDIKESAKLYSLEDAVDFELSLGKGGDTDDWVNILRSSQVLGQAALDPDDTSSCSLDSGGTLAKEKCYISCGTTWNFLEQKYTVCLRLPSQVDGVYGDQPLELFLRPSLNPVYRNRIWPTKKSELKKFDSVLVETPDSSDNEIVIAMGLEELSASDTITIVDNNKNEFTYTISGDANAITLNFTDNTRIVKLASTLDQNFVNGNRVFVDLAENEKWAEPYFSYHIDTNFYSDWNPLNADLLLDFDSLAITWTDCLTKSGFSPYNCADTTTPFNLDLINWMGFHDYSNDWSDAAFYPTLLESNANPFVQSPTGTALQFRRGNFESATAKAHTDNAEDDIVTGNAVTDSYSIIAYQSSNGSNISAEATLIDNIDFSEITQGFSLADCAGNQTNLQVVLDETNATFVWESADGGDRELRFRVVSLADIIAGNEPTDCGTLLSTLSEDYELTEIKSVDTKVFVRAQYVDGNTYQRAWFIDSVGATISATEMTIVDADEFKATYTHVQSDYVIVYWWRNTNAPQVLEAIVFDSTEDEAQSPSIIHVHGTTAADSVMSSIDFNMIDDNIGYFTFLDETEETGGHSDDSVVWTRKANFDLANQTFTVNTAVQINTTPERHYDVFTSEVDANIMAMAWTQRGTSGDWEVYMRLFDTNTELPLGTSDFAVSTSMVYRQRVAADPIIYTNGAGNQRIFVLFRSDEDDDEVYENLYYRIYDVEDENFLSAPVLLNTGTQFQVSEFHTSLSQNQLFISWIEDIGLTTQDRIIQIYDLDSDLTHLQAGGAPIYEPLTADEFKAAQESKLFLEIVDGRFFVSWTGGKSTTDYNGYYRYIGGRDSFNFGDLSFDSDNQTYGLNHFFVAPLVERNFEIKATIGPGI